MNFGVTEGRNRSLIYDKGNLKIKNIFSGPDPKGFEVYPGDKGIKFEDSLCIQIHKIRIKGDTLSVKWGGQVLYTLGIYYPEDFAHSFVGIKK